MGQILVRNLDDAIIERLKQKAKCDHTSPSLDSTILIREDRDNDEPDR